MGLIGEALEPPRMRGIRASSMGHQVRAHRIVCEIHQVKSRRTRGKRKVGDADEIPVADAVLMLLEGVERAPQQTGIDLAVDAFCPSES